jgi:tellurite methyltransferase
MDVSVAGIEKLRNLAQAKGLSVRTEVQDLRKYHFKGKYDLIVAHGCLHYIERGHWVRLIDRIKSHTNAGGYNVIAVCTDSIPPSDDLKDFTIGLFHEGELFELYKGWRTVLEQSYVLEDEHPGSMKHRHPINKLVAQKQ